VNLPVLEHAA